MAELCLWVKDKTGAYVQRWVDKEEWKNVTESRREEEKLSKEKALKTGIAPPTTAFGASLIEVKVRDEETGTFQTFPLSELSRANPREQDGVGDMTSLTFLEEPTMLHNMRFRFAKDMIYTAISRILCAANPYRYLQIYSEEEMRRYRGAERLEALPPHIFATAERAYQALKRGPNQSMICCGESGSGKTESTKLLMRYLATAKQGRDNKEESKESPVQAKVLQANPILEAFGNASTLMNNNSSRFAKFTKLYFSSDYDLVSADIVTYLLEKSRVVTPPPGERNYHSFYSLFYIPPNFQSLIKANLHTAGKKPDDFHYLRGTKHEGRIDDNEFTRDMLVGMQTLGFSEELRDSILQTLSGILHLGNIQPFSSDVKETHPDVDIAAELLGVKKSGLVHALTTREITTRGETIFKPRDPSEFGANRDTMAKALYHGVFEAIVTAINSAFTGGKAKEGKWIGVLDVFGFEHFEHNSFEQLCINFCNEKLQQFFNSYIISSEQEEYEKEGIFWSTLDTRDRSGCLRLFEAKTPPGIYALLDSANAQSSTSKQFLGVLMNQHKYNRFIFKPKPVATRHQTAEEKRKQDLLELSFGVKHYAAQVIYDSTELLTKNADKIDPATLNLYNGSSNPFIKSLLAKQDPAARKESVGTFFMNQLGELETTLKKTSPHFIRCINPNNKKTKQLFEPRYVLPQLVNGGLIEAVRMLKLGYPTRYPYTLFFKTFEPLLKPTAEQPPEDKSLDPQTLAQQAERFHSQRVTLVKSKTSHPRYVNIRDFCEGAMRAFGLERDQYQCGLTKMFFRSGMQELVEETLEKGKKPDELSPKIIHKLEWWLTYKRILRLRGSTKFLGKLWLRQRRTNAARQLQVAIRTNLAWEGRVHWKSRRIDAVNRLRIFWFWCKHDRQIGFLRRGVQKVLDQIREAKQAEQDRRKQEKNRTPAHVLADLADWISVITGEGVISSLFPALKSGELFCTLLTKIKKDLTIEGVHVGKKQLFFARDNLSKAAKALGYNLRCPQNLLFTPDDLLSTTTPNNKKVVFCLQWLARHAYTKYEVPLPKYLQAKLDAGGDLGDDDEESDRDSKSVGPPGLTVPAGMGEGVKGPPPTPRKKQKEFGDVSDDEEDEKTTDKGGAAVTEPPSGVELTPEEKKKLDEARAEAARAALKKGGRGRLPPSRRQTMRKTVKGGTSSYPSDATPRVSVLGGTLSLPADQKDVMEDLKTGFELYMKLMMEGARFRQYTPERVAIRHLRVALPRETVSKVPTFDSLFANPQLRLLFTKDEDHNSLTMLVNLSDIQFVFSGKRGGGNNFPDESKAAGGDSTLAPEKKCLVIGTAHRTLALEAESERYRDTWVEALEWALLLFREATKDKAAQKEGKDAQESDQVLDPLLTKGAMFTKHGLQGITRRVIKCTSTHIYWLKGEDSPLSECVDPIAWETVSEILRGKQTLMFSRSRAKAVADELCVSIVYRADHRSLDLVADSEEQAFEFYSALSGYLQELQEKYAKSRSKIAMEAELEAVRATLARERDQHIKSVSELAEQSTKTESELEQLQKQREALHSKYSNRESEMEALKNMMQEEKGQLIERISDLNTKVKDLTQQLDTELQRNATLLEELQAARSYKLELLALRQEVAEQRSARSAMSLELSSLLSTWNAKFGSLHAAITKPQGTGTTPTVTVTPPS